MLKRQRPASPVPSRWDAVVDEKSLTEDIYKPVSKRRRYFTPSRIDPSMAGPTSTKNDHDIFDTGPSTLPMNCGVRTGVREWQKDAGEYRNANTLLHDLHTEQRHRLVFANGGLLPYSPPPDNDGSRHGIAYFPTGEGPPSSHVQNPSDGHYSELPSKQRSSTPTDDESQMVARRYGETNK
jgi:hypothetical protein